MPFTPLHMGPGILIKAVLQGSFSLMIFGWTQILMDIQPLLVMLTGQGHLHGFTHTFVGAVLIAVVAVLSGKHLSEWGLRFLRIATVQQPVQIRWWVAIISALIGSFSHVGLDSIMHGDVEPFYPFDLYNPWLGVLSIKGLHLLCLYSGGVGAVLYFALRYWLRCRCVGKGTA